MMRLGVRRGETGHPFPVQKRESAGKFPTFDEESFCRARAIFAAEIGSGAMAAFKDDMM